MIRIFADSRQSRHPSPAGWSYVLREPGGTFVMRSGGACELTGRGAAVESINRALAHVKEFFPCESDITVWSTGTTAIQSLERGWVDSWARNNGRNSIGRPVPDWPGWHELLAHQKRLGEHPARIVHARRHDSWSTEKDDEILGEDGRHMRKLAGGLALEELSLLIGHNDTNVLTVVIRNGRITGIHRPRRARDLVVRIEDHDVDGVNDADLRTGTDGNRCTVSVWKP